jgi:hypothetical protein
LLDLKYVNSFQNASQVCAVAFTVLYTLSIENWLLKFTSKTGNSIKKKSTIFGMTTHFKIGSSHYDKIKKFRFQFWILLIKNNNNGNFIKQSVFNW